jgi:cell division protein FtsA
VRAVIATVSKNHEVAIVGYNEGKSTGMRKGIPANLAGPASAIDKMLGDAERMGGYDVRNAYVSVNGSTVISTHTEGMIAVGTAEHEINDDDLDRVEDVAVSGRIPANRDVLDVIALEYALDGQGGIKDPLGMSGARLEMRACVISALTPNCENLRKATQTADVNADRLIPAVVAAAKAVLSERQKENGVAVIDLGAATTSIAIYEEGDLQYVSVIPIGSNNITNDLAIVLAINPELAEEIKKRISVIQKDTEEAVVSMQSGTNEVQQGTAAIREVGEQFSKIMDMVNDIEEQVRGISTSVDKVSTNTTNIVSAVDDIDDVSRKTSEHTQAISAAAEEQSASSEEIASASQALATLATDLQTAIGRFKV